MKHHLIAVKGSSSESLKEVKILYSNEQATKDEYTKALQSYQEYLIEIKSAQLRGTRPQHMIMRGIS